MGFVERYWREAEEKKIPHYRRVAIVELQTGSARVQRRGLANVSDQEFPELPLEFPTYEEAFAWVERKLTQRAPDRLRDEAKLSERKTVHEWLNDAGIPAEEYGKPICLLRRLRIAIDMLPQIGGR